MKTLLLLLLLSCAHLRLDALELPRRNSGRQGWKRKSSSSGINNSPLNLGLIVPHSIYNDREYNKAVGATLGELQRSKRTEFKFLQDIEFAQDQVYIYTGSPFVWRRGLIIFLSRFTGS